MVLPLLVSSAVAAILVDAPTAAALAAAPNAVVLDTRGLPSYLTGHVPGAVRVDWRIGTTGGFFSGKVGDPAALAAAFAALGVRDDGPVLVVGAWTDGWGEEGRVAWDLAWLGHRDVHVLRGGMNAWRGSIERWPAKPRAGSFTARVAPELRVDARSLRNDPEAWTVVDVRTPEEYAGATPYGEARGGHIPGAVNAPWEGLVEGVVGVRNDKPVAVYCTGGVRSGFAWMLLTDAGYRVANYDGSWWEWAEIYGE